MSAAACAAANSLDGFRCRTLSESLTTFGVTVQAPDGPTDVLCQTLSRLKQKFLGLCRRHPLASQSSSAMRSWLAYAKGRLLTDDQGRQRVGKSREKTRRPRLNPQSGNAHLAMMSQGHASSHTTRSAAFPTSIP